ncbi:hypothetical protein GIB67_018920 [Kingdonia uniflora]|uniref:BSD domain-containing protein n=1 Tax=Kingdonia uniflora TaxID=39325 RepID=A0A7J7L2M3_9MAGN|nr:hypothetical protein GIB67_018920 [Kingdonia uniflora]
MSWIARSIVNSLKLDDDEESQTNSINGESQTHTNSSSSDFSQLTKTLTRQLWGVASFLAPPSSPSPPTATDSSVSEWNRWEPPRDTDLEVSESARIAGIRSDFAEIGGKFKTGISRISNHKAVSEISKIASTFLPFGSSGEEGGNYLLGEAIGVTEEVLTFARNISMHPETWLDFPLSDDEDSDGLGRKPIARMQDYFAKVYIIELKILLVLFGVDWLYFDMSDAQQEHALAVERLAPRLAALRIELCPGYMSEGCFWRIYFVLLHSRLNKHDAELLSTPQIVEARAMLMQDLQNRMKPEPERSGSGTFFPNSLQEEHLSSPSNSLTNTTPLETFSFEPIISSETSDFETEKHAVVSTEIQIVDKSVVEEESISTDNNRDVPIGSSFKAFDQKYEEDGDEWLEDENSETDGFTGTTVPIENEEDVSFSDLEDNDDNDGFSAPSISKAASYNSSNAHPIKNSQDGVQLEAKNGQSDVRAEHSGIEPLHAKTPENKDSNDWLNVDFV